MENIKEIKHEDFQKLNLKVAQIKQAEEIKNADNLYKLTLNDGTPEPRTIVAGIKQHYTKEELQNKKIIIIANLEPRTLKGIESQGMLLAASTSDHKKVILLTTDKEIENGTKIS